MNFNESSFYCYFESLSFTMLVFSQPNKEFHRKLENSALQVL